MESGDSSFPCKTGVDIYNWSKTFSCTPEMFCEPTNVDELKQILLHAQSKKRTVRVMGAGHSPSDIAFTNDILVSMRRMNHLISVNKELCQVTVESGMLIDELNPLLTENGLALSVLPSVSDMSIGGAVGTGTHGSGINYGTLSSYVTALDLLIADGTVLHCSREENSEVFLAAACGLGAMGIVIQLTLQCEPRFNLTQKHYGEKMSTVLANLDQHLKNSEHFKFMWYPHTDDVIVCEINRTPYNKITKDKLLWERFWMILLFLSTYLIEFLYWVSTFIPGITAYINRLAFHLHKGPTEVDDVSYRIFNFDCLFQQFVTDWAIPIEKTGEAVTHLKEWLDTQDDTVVAHFPVEVRFVKKDDMYMSPAYGRDTAFINIIVYRPYGKEIMKDQLWTYYENLMEKHDGRPHWAKEHKVDGSKLVRMYPHFKDWCRIRENLDPNRIFVNRYISQLLGSDASQSML
ncbi:L-gulonolactone oxidase-like isoform X2 [Paramacrobiotus metropolitanus]|uniref:L-gulonolactone oxidase-like isoform X2 n=1 Tax=Paramacrobiotus metropolitanus TaxID=2943436 RepID=UPI0024462682|nr:L-gulonolactone oxidase-like isoform X2 [Paramacrobiotus metropolitanus]